MRAVLCEMVFPISDMLETLFPDVLIVQRLVRQLLKLQYLRMHADDQHFFVMRTIEDADLSAFRQIFLAAPKKIVIKLLRRWLLERHDLTTLRINAAHHVLDRPVFTGRVHRLKEHKQRVLILRIQDILQLSQPLNISPKIFYRFGFLGIIAREIGWMISKIHLRTFGNAKSVRFHMTSDYHNRPPNLIP